MTRLPYVTADTSTPAADLLKALPDLRLFAMVAHARDVFVHWLTYGGGLLASTALDPQLRELAILQVAASAPSRYEWAQHEAIAAELGVPSTQVEAVQAGRLDDPALAREGRAVCGAVRELVDSHTLSPDRFSELSDHLDAREIVELMLVVGHYLAIAVLANAVDLDIDADVGATVVDLAKRVHTEASSSAPGDQP